VSRARSLFGHQTAIPAVILVVVGILGCLTVFAGRAAGATAELRYVDPVSDLLSGCLLQAFRLDTGLPEGASIAGPPDGSSLVDASGLRAGKLRFAGGEYTVGVSLGTEGVLLYADTDQDGELTHVSWDGMTNDQRLIATVPLRIYEEPEQERHYPLLLLWDPFVPLVLAYCRGGYTSGTIELDGAGYLVAVVDDNTDGRYDDLDSGTLFIDADQDGELLATMDSHEQFALDEPFNLGGITYAVAEVAPDGTVIVIEQSDRSVPVKAPLIEGAAAPTFTALTVSEASVSLEDFRGRVVLLDFWAGWCSPCVRELPVVQALHDRWSEQGLVVIGINHDRSEAAMERAIETHELTYMQIFDGEDTVSDLYRITGIPMTYLLDREGTIIARGLRGNELTEAVEATFNLDLEGDPDEGG